MNLKFKPIAFESFISKPGKVSYETITAVVYFFVLAIDLSDTYMVNVALPSIKQHFILHHINVAWVLTSYLLSFLSVIPLSGWLGDKFSTKKILLIALIFYVIGSFLSGISGSIYFLLICRFLQGIGGGLLVPVGQSIMFKVFPKESLAKALGLIGFAALVGPSCATVLGGTLVNYFSWRCVFFINIPIVIVSLLIVFCRIKESKHTDPGSIDILGMLLSVSFLSGFLLLLSSIGNHADVSRQSGIEILLLLGLLTFFIKHELRKDKPLIDLKVFLIKEYSVCQSVIFLSLISAMGSIFLTTLFFQDGLKLSPLNASLLIFPLPLGLLLMFIMIKRLYNLLGTRVTVISGLLIYSLLTLLMLSIKSASHVIYIWLIMFGRGIGFGMLNVPLQVTAFQKIQSQQIGRASAVWNTFRCLSNILGIALFAMVLTYIEKMQGSSVGLFPYYICFIVCAVLGFMALGITTLLPKEI